MFGQFAEQLKKSTQPANAMFAANVKVLEQMSQHSTELFSGVINDSVKLIQTCGQQPELKSVIAAQSMYAESMRERVTSTSKTNYNLLNAASQELVEAMRNGLETTAQAAAAPAPASPKTTVKKATRKPSTAKKAAPKSTATAVNKASESTPVAPKTTAKTSAKVAPVAKLSADEVKATSSKSVVKTEVSKDVKPAATKSAAPKTQSKA